MKAAAGKRNVKEYLRAQHVERADNKRCKTDLTWQPRHVAKIFFTKNRRWQGAQELFVHQTTETGHAWTCVILGLLKQWVGCQDVRLRMHFFCIAMQWIYIFCVRQHFCFYSDRHQLFIYDYTGGVLLRSRSNKAFHAGSRTRSVLVTFHS